MIDTDLSVHIHESNLIEGYDSEIADAQSIMAWEWLLEQPKLNKRVVCQLQKRIVHHQDDLKPEWRGKYRTIPVYIGGREAMHYQFINQAMTAWLHNMPGTKPHEHHVAFEKIHPFVDGNGRTGRMLMWWQQIKVKGITPTLIYYKDRADYYRWFK